MEKESFQPLNETAWHVSSERGPFDSNGAPLPLLAVHYSTGRLFSRIRGFYPRYLEDGEQVPYYASSSHLLACRCVAVCAK